MSDDREHVTDELGSYSLDDEDQLQPEDTLDAGSEEGGVDDVLDRGFSPPDGARSPHLWGTTAYEQSHEETIEQRIAQEIPDPHSAYGAPDNESGLDVDPRLGGDDPDSIPADRDWVGDSSEPVTRLVAPDEGQGADTERDSVARSTGVPDSSPEGSAMHYVDEDEELED